nr:hypothetical protein [uncultured Devosia sp.]
MFERRTVFVVGAGGSRELGLPMGSELASNIGGRVKFTFPDGYSPTGGDNDVYWAVKSILEQQKERDPNPMFRAGQAISRGMSQAISIDNFLHTHGHDKNITLMGKLGIAAAILEAERNSAIFHRDEGQRDLIEFSELKETWHSVFVKMLLERSVRRDISDVFDNVSIITFNYDRCIERYLHHSLQSYLGLSAKDAELLMSRLSIIHPYGQVGKLPSTAEGGIAFGEHIHSTKLPLVAAQIRTFTERVESDDVLFAMRKLLSEAEVVVYLGFSFGDMNMELMSLETAGSRVVYGTSFGVSKANQRVIEQDILEAMGPNQSVVEAVTLEPMTCVDFLNAYWKPIIRGV